MRYDLHNRRDLTFTTTVAATQWPRRLTLLPLLCMGLLAGCLGAKFDHDFSSLAAQPTQPLTQLEGAWEGSWQSSAQAGHHMARAVVILNSRGKHNIRLEFSDFELEPGVSNFPFDKYWIELRNLPIASSVGASNEFQTKIGLEKAHKSNLIAVAMTLQGCTQGDTMHIQFSTNDALNDLEDGRIDLRRLVKHCAHSPLSLAFPTNETK